MLIKQSQKQMQKYTLRYTSLVALTVENLPAMLETRVLSLGWEDSLEKEMANHSSILVWEIPWTEEPGQLQFMKSQESRLVTKSLPPSDSFKKNISFSNL